MNPKTILQGLGVAALFVACYLVQPILDDLPGQRAVAADLDDAMSQAVSDHAAELEARRLALAEHRVHRGIPLP